MTYAPVNVLEAIPVIAGFMKTSVGVINNASWLICLDAHDAIQQHPAYRGRCKRAYKDAIDRFHRYERTLVHAQVNRLFHVDDLPEDKRKQYGDITDRDYYEMWASSGSMAYMNTKPLITSLWNKYRVSLISHKVPHADLMAWPMAAMCTLKLAVKAYNSGVQGVCNTWKLPKRVVDGVFGQLSLEQVAKSWANALMLTSPEVMDYDLDEIEERNIMLGIHQLEMEWTSPDILLGSIYKAVKDYGENFSDKAAHRSAMKRILDIKKGATEDLK